MLVIESWVINDDSPVPVSSAGGGGKLLAFVTNAERGMVVLLEGEDDPGEHGDGEFIGPHGQADPVDTALD